MAPSTEPHSNRQPEGLAVLIGDIQGNVADIRESIGKGIVVVIAPSVHAAWKLLVPNEPHGNGETAGGSREANPVVRIDGLEIDARAQQVRWKGTPLVLTPHEVEILAALVAQPGVAYPARALVSTVWDTTYYRNGALLRSAVWRLNRKFVAAGAEIRIEAVRGTGYRLVFASPG